VYQIIYFFAAYDSRSTSQNSCLSIKESRMHSAEEARADFTRRSGDAHRG
jgi:hypothetical protein